LYPVPASLEHQGPESNLFGLEPNFGCCTANMHQGCPKFTASLWMSDGKNGLAAVAYAPCQVQVILAQKTPIAIEEETEYPFGEEVTLHVNPESPAEFPLHLRILGRAQGAHVRVNHRSVDRCEPGTFVTLGRRWEAWRPRRTAISQAAAYHAVVSGFDRCREGAPHLFHGPANRNGITLWT
jgi:DUF1680 family protein